MVKNSDMLLDHWTGKNSNIIASILNDVAQGLSMGKSVGNIIISREIQSAIIRDIGFESVQGDITYFVGYPCHIQGGFLPDDYVINWENMVYERLTNLMSQRLTAIQIAASSITSHNWDSQRMRRSPVEIESKTDSFGKFLGTLLGFAVMGLGNMLGDQFLQLAGLAITAISIFWW